MEFTDEMTLKQARDLLRTRVEDGEKCPCCTQFAKVYRFPMNAAMARGLILMWRRYGANWGSVPDLGLPGGHFLKFRYWGFIEKPPELRRGDGSERVGLWRITPAGTEWVQGRSTNFSHARIYNNRCLGLTGKQVDIQRVLGKRFNYAELMAGA